MTEGLDDLILFNSRQNEVTHDSINVGKAFNFFFFLKDDLISTGLIYKITVVSQTINSSCMHVINYNTWVN